MRLLFIIALVCVVIGSGFSQEGRFTISGNIKDNTTGEDLIGATVFVKSLAKGTTSNHYGFYSLTLEVGTYELVYSYLGLAEETKTFVLDENQVVDVELRENNELLSEIVVSADSEREAEHVSSTTMGMNNLEMTTVKKLPALFGEVDVIKAIQLLPGVQMMGEGSSGFYVRGGGVDQNLVLLDEAPVYNPSHLFGFFSAFNAEVIKGMKLYKGAVPAQYGGRLSSVLDIRMKDGNTKKVALSGGVGTVMSRLAVEAPLGEHGSIILAGRRSYLDILAKAALALTKGDDQDENQGMDLYFYDANVKANYKITDNDRIYASGYYGRDVVRDDAEDLGLSWGNATSTFRWNHLFSPKLFSNLTYYYSNYDYKLDFSDELSTIVWNSKLQEHSLKLDFGAYLSPESTLRYGVSSIYHTLRPGEISSVDDNQEEIKLDIQTNQSYENALYVAHELDVSDRFKVEYGLRLSSLLNVGPQEVYLQDAEYQVIDTVNHTSGIYNSYWNLEPRLGLRYQLSDQSSVKFNYNRMTQYIHLASNGNSATPFDIWFTSSPNIKPQKVDQLGVGYFYNFNNSAYQLSVETYYKRYQNSIDFKDHAALLLNSNLEGDLRIGEGRAYGAEFMLKKEKGRLTGWISYAYSKAEKKIASINDGAWYNAKYDKPHDIAVVASYDINDRISVGSNFVYSTGGAVTFPVGKYEFGGNVVPVYSRRNGARLPDYHRLDLSLTLKSVKNKDRRFQSEWVFSIYNAYNRKNAFAINFKQEEANPQVTYAEKASIFSIVPSITWNAKF